MSTSILYHAFGVAGVKYLATDYLRSQVTFHAEMTTQCLQCPKCSGLHFKFREKYIRRFHMIPFGKKPCFLNLTLHRVECRSCSHLYRPTLPFMPDSKRMTRSFIRMAAELLAFGTIKDVADFLQAGWDTVKRIHKEHLKNKYRTIPLEEIECVSIDEFSLKKGHHYMTVVTDLASGAIIHAIEGRKKEDIKPFFLKLKKMFGFLRGDYERKITRSLFELLNRSKSICNSDRPFRSFKRRHIKGVNLLSCLVRYG